MNLQKYTYKVPFEKVDAKYYSVIVFAPDGDEAQKILDKYLDEGLEGEFPEFYVQTLETEVDRDKIELEETETYDEEADKEELEVQKDLLQSIEDFYNNDDSESEESNEDD